MSINHEELLIHAFIIKQKRERYLNLIASSKGRVKLRAMLPHCRDFDQLCLHKISADKQHIADIMALLKKHNAPAECYIIAERANYDETTMPLYEAFENIFGSGLSFIISCLPGKLAYYEGEDAGERYILINKPELL